jgi:hypothetical protein
MASLATILFAFSLKSHLFRPPLKMRIINFIVYPSLVYGLFYASGYGPGNDFPDPKNSQLPWLNFEGEPTTVDSEKVALPYKVCMTQTARTHNWKFINWHTFGPTFGQWLLPWLCFTAQLPFETRNTRTSFMSLLMILGSPLLGAYSLSLMLLNANWISRTFRQLGVRARCAAPPDGCEKEDVLESVRRILIEVQHVPIKIVLGENHDLVQMVVRPENKPAWVNLAREIFKTKREITLSLITQLAGVAVSQVLTVVQFFTAGEDDNSIFLGVAVNCLWSWMIPLVFGYVYVGAQRNATSVRDAINAIKPPRINKVERRAWRGPGLIEEGGMIDTIYDRSLEEKVDSCNFLVDRTNEVEERKITRFWGFPIAGWEKEPGPVFVFARRHSHMVACEHMRKGFEQLVKRKKREISTRSSWGDFETNLAGRSSDVEAPKDLDVHNGAPKVVRFNFIVSCLVGFFLQWSTVGSAILIAFK